MGYAFLFWAFAGLFALAGRAFAAAAFAGADFIAFLFIFAALAGLYTGALYFGASIYEVNPGRMFKDQGGKLRWISRVLIAPYLFFEYQTWRLYRRRDREPLFEEVRPGLFLGSRPLERDWPKLERAGITAVLDLVAELAAPPGLSRSARISYLCIPVLDGTSPAAQDLFAAVNFVSDSLAAGRKVLVHCTFGHGRSALVVAAALIKLGEARDPEDAFRKLQKLKRLIHASREQKRLLDREWRSLAP